MEVYPHPRNVFAAIFMEGHTVISLLMVLSGFIFTYGAYGDRIVYWQFIRNRALRVYPLFLLLLFVGMYSFPAKFDLVKIMTMVLTLENVQHIPLYRPFTSIFWTIYVELQFYLLFPFLLSILNRRGIKYLVGIIGVALAFRFLSLLEGAPVRDLTHFTILGRIDQFLIGMIAAVVYRKYFTAGPRWDALFVGCALLLGTGMWLLNRIGGWPVIPGWRILLPPIEGLLWAGIALGYFSLVRFMPAIASKIIASLGVISYSTYLLHMTLINIASKYGFYKLLPGYSAHRSACIGTLLYVVPAVVTLSILTYHFIEKPFLEMRGKYRLPRLTAPIA